MVNRNLKVDTARQKVVSHMNYAEKFQELLDGKRRIVINEDKLRIAMEKADRMPKVRRRRYRYIQHDGYVEAIPLEQKEARA